MGEPVPDLARLVTRELERPAPEAARLVSRRIEQRFGPALAATLFYGSCLRRDVVEGVLDFYALVDSYRAAYPSRLLALANAVLPPNVFYLELPSPSGTLRAKYAVVSLRDFEAGAGPGSIRPSIWARFSQPAVAVYVRDAESRSLLLRSAERALTTALYRIVPLLPACDGVQRFTPEEFWLRALHETYAAEMRTESPESIRSLYAADPGRYDAAARAGLAMLSARGFAEVRSEGQALRVVLPPARRRAGRLTWALRRRLSKLVYAVALLKSAATFGDWLPYVLWKLERHTGARLVPSERQRRHPLVFGWPLLFRALWRRDLH